MEYLIDARGKRLGRVATEAARVLLGKHEPKLVKKNAVANVTVRVTNAGAISISEKKRVQKRYHSHSGHPGSDRSLQLEHIVTKKGKRDALRRAVHGMLPTNTLREKRLKHLIIEE